MLEYVPSTIDDIPADERELRRVGGLIRDWDGAGPGSRLWDLGYAAHGFVPLHPGGDPARDAPRLRAHADGYGLDADQRADRPP